MNGRGTFKWPDKRIYEGEYLEDKKHGYGIFSWPDGRKYKGYWQNGKQHGKGDFYNPALKLWRSGIWSYGKRLCWEDEKDTSIEKQYTNRVTNDNMNTSFTKIEETVA